MDERTYDRWSDDTLRGLRDGIDALGLDEIDATLSHGVLEIEVEDGARLFVSRQPPLRQLWLATPDAAFKFDGVEGRWVDRRAGRELGEALSEALSEVVSRALGRAVRLEVSG